MTLSFKKILVLKLKMLNSSEIHSEANQQDQIVEAQHEDDDNTGYQSDTDSPT